MARRREVPLVVRIHPPPPGPEADAALLAYRRLCWRLATEDVMRRLAEEEAAGD